MSWRTSPLALAARNIGRMLGANDWIANVLGVLNGNGYETRYDEAFQQALKPDDCVWDVGANIGYYTQLFATRVGPKGIVHAFEPSPENFARLKAACDSIDQVRCHPFGMGEQNGEVSFAQGEDKLGATSRVVVNGGGYTVEVRSGDDLVLKGEATPPNAIKIDVEGYELEVLWGLANQLRTSDLRVIGIEVHFRILKERGLPAAPKQIETLLRGQGFLISWPDASHLLATRHSNL